MVIGRQASTGWRQRAGGSPRLCGECRQGRASRSPTSVRTRGSAPSYLTDWENQHLGQSCILMLAAPPPHTWESFVIRQHKDLRRGPAKHRESGPEKEGERTFLNHSPDLPWRRRGGQRNWPGKGKPNSKLNGVLWRELKWKERKRWTYRVLISAASTEYGSSPGQDSGVAAPGELR